MKLLLILTAILKWLNRTLAHECYPGKPHLARDGEYKGRMVRVCYECGKTRLVKMELVPSKYAEPGNSEAIR